MHHKNTKHLTSQSGDPSLLTDLGRAAIQPDGLVIAGSFITITYTYTCGFPIDDSGYLKITFRSVTDVGDPQFEDPLAPNYCMVTTNGNCRIETRWDPKGHYRPWSRALFLMVRGGYLDRGEEIKVVFGDTSQGSPGWRMQTNCTERFEFRTFVDPIATYQFKQLPASPALKIGPGKPIRAICLAPSQIEINRPFIYFLKLEDRWGNPTAEPQRYTHQGFDREGLQTILAEDTATGLSARSNPVQVQTQDRAVKKFWADFHGQTGETVGERSIEDYFRFARDFGLLDIAAHSANDFQVTDEFWEHINQVTHRFYQPGTFVTFPGYEWSGNTPLGGDRNVYFESEGGQITRSSTELLPGNHSIYKNSPNAVDLFQNLSEKSGPRPFAFAHVGGRYANLDMHDPETELAVEIHSAWGTFEWILSDAFERRYRIGICANSDGHKCRPGASYPGAAKFGSLGGLTCVLAPQLDRESIVYALRARHFYATTGNRPLIDLKLLVDGVPLSMGDTAEIGVETPHLHLSLIGTAPIDQVEIRNASTVIHRVRPYNQGDLGKRVKIIWRGAQVRGRDRLVHWDGDLFVHNNSVLNAVPLNFWNADHPLTQRNAHTLTWKSVTTGGTAGMILTLENLETGTIKINTRQGDIEVDIASIGLEPLIWDFGGLHKEINIYRLPDRQEITPFTLELPLTGLHPGDNPIYIHLVQEDEHRAWTSPIYLLG